MCRISHVFCVSWISRESSVAGFTDFLNCCISNLLQDPEALTKLMDTTEQALTHAIEVEEKIPLENVTNFDELVADVKNKLAELRDVPNRLENPVIYHLDVGKVFC